MRRFTITCLFLVIGFWMFGIGHSDAGGSTSQTAATPFRSNQNRETLGVPAALDQSDYAASLVRNLIEISQRALDRTWAGASFSQSLPNHLPERTADHGDRSADTFNRVRTLVDQMNAVSECESFARGDESFSGLDKGICYMAVLEVGETSSAR